MTPPLNPYQQRLLAYVQANGTAEPAAAVAWLDRHTPAWRQATAAPASHTVITKERNHDDDPDLD